MTVQVNTDLCTGCGRCVEICPEGAIAIDQFLHKAVIDAFRCIECGACIDSCKKGAISFNPGFKDNTRQFMQREASPRGRGGSGSSELRGSGRGRGAGSGRGGACGRGNRQSPDVIGECYCPGCNISVPHRAGIPCSQIKCPKCGTPMIRK